MKAKKSRLGFTINEVLITTGIIAMLTAIAVPNFLRMKMNVNMELVKQNLKIIGQNMNDLFNKYKEFPADISNLGTSEEELAITASLFAIDKRDYTTNGYQTFTNRTNYQLTTCPKEGKWGIAGDKCFILTPLGISISIIPQAALQIPMLPMEGIRSEGFLAALLQEGLTTSQRASILAGLIQMQGFDNSSIMQSMLSCAKSTNCHMSESSLPADWKDRTPSSYLTVFESQLNAFRKLLPEVSKQLESKGFQLYYEEKGIEKNYQEGGQILGVTAWEMPGPGAYRTDGIGGITWNDGEKDDEKGSEYGNIYMFQVALISKNPISASQVYDGMNAALSYANSVYENYGYNGNYLTDPYTGESIPWTAG